MPPAEPRRVLIAGNSTRAAAESAARAGFAVTAIDAFSDLDQEPGVRALGLQRDFGVRFSAQAAARVAREVDCDAVVYSSSFENHPRAVSLLAAGRALWGNAPSVVRRVRDPGLVAQALARRGFDVPAVRTAPVLIEPVLTEPGIAKPESGTKDPKRGSSRVEPRWLVKPLLSGGGHRVRAWQGRSLPRGCHLQEFVDGVAGSVVFVAASGGAVPIGVSRQLVGERAFGAAGYRYCGSILASAGDPQFAHDARLVEQAARLARVVAEEFGVVGANGIDFIARGGVPYPVEVNPRWSASMELVERAYGLSVFAAHAAACARGTLPEFDLCRARAGAGAVGKAILFAHRDVIVGDTRAWLVDGDGRNVRDVPHPGERIRAGGPVCTVFATGADSAACHAALIRRAERVYAELAAWAGRVT